MAALSTIALIGTLASIGTAAYQATESREATQDAKKEMKAADAKSRSFEEEYKAKQAKDAQTAAQNAAGTQKARLRLLQGGAPAKPGAMGASDNAAVVRKMALGL